MNRHSASSDEDAAAMTTSRLKRPSASGVFQRSSVHATPDLPKENRNPSSGTAVRTTYAHSRMVPAKPVNARRVPPAAATLVANGPPMRQSSATHGSEASVDIIQQQREFLSQVQEHNKRLQEERNDISKRYEAERQAAERMRAELMLAQGEAAAARRDCEHLLSRVSRDDGDVERLRRELDDQKTKLAVMSAEKGVFEEMISQERSRMATRDEEVSESQKTIELLEQRLEASLMEREEFEAACGALDTERLNLRDHIDTLSEDIRKHVSALSACEQTREGAEKRAEKIDLRNRALEDQVSSLERERATSRDEIERLSRQTHTELEALRVEYDISARQKDAELKSLTMTNEMLESQMEKTVTELKLAQENCTKLQSSIQQQQVSSVTLKAQNDALEVALKSKDAECGQKDLEVQDLLERLDLQLAYIAELDVQMRKDEDVRRKLHNTVQELKGNIRVFCRLRPQFNDEGDSTMYNLDETTGEIVMSQPSQKRGHDSSQRQTWQFSFDRVFGPQATQRDVFAEISAVAQSALDGYKVCLFAYGQTGSGKTHTMIGDVQRGSTSSGMIPRCMEMIFNQARDLGSRGWNFVMRASFLEIYNETINDLLAKDDAKKKYEVKQERDTMQVYVTDLMIEEVDSPEDVHELLSRAMKNRATAATNMNDRSSRSHSVFQLRIDGSNPLSGQQLNGQLNLIDLAGSERLNSSQSKGDRLKETQHINKSLSALGDVIAALANKEKHVPFRNSKLTYVLQDALGGNCKTLMFVNVSPAVDSFQESLCSLRFASKVNSCDIGTARRKVKVAL